MVGYKGPKLKQARSLGLGFRQRMRTHRGGLVYLVIMALLLFSQIQIQIQTGYAPMPFCSHVPATEDRVDFFSWIAREEEAKGKRA